MSPAPSTGCTLKKTEETVLIHGNGCRSRVRRVREHERASFSHIRSGDLREGARRSEGEWEHPVKVAQFGKKIILQAAKMDFPDDGGVEKKTKQEGKQRKKRFYAADFFGYDVFSVFEVKGILYCCILPYTTDHCEHKKCAHEFLCD